MTNKYLQIKFRYNYNMSSLTNPMLLVQQMQFIKSNLHCHHQIMQIFYSDTLYIFKIV